MISDGLVLAGFQYCPGVPFSSVRSRSLPENLAALWVWAGPKQLFQKARRSGGQSPLFVPDNVKTAFDIEVPDRYFFQGSAGYLPCHGAVGKEGAAQACKNPLDDGSRTSQGGCPLE